MAAVKNPEKKTVVSAADLGAQHATTYDQRTEGKGKKLLTLYVEDAYYGMMDSLAAKWGLKDHTAVVKEALRRAYSGK